MQVSYHFKWWLSNESVFCETTLSDAPLVPAADVSPRNGVHLKFSHKQSIDIK